MTATKPTILFTTPELAYPPVGGPELRILNSIRALSRFSDLHIISQRSAEAIGGDAARQSLQQLCSEFSFVPIQPKPRRVLKLTRKIRRSIHRRIGLGLPDTRVAEYRYILEEANRIQADLIWLGYGNISYPLLRYIKEHSAHRVVIDTDSVWSRFVLRGLPFAESADHAADIQRTGDAKAEEERWGTKLADVTTAVSEIDAEYYRQFSQDPDKIRLFTNVVDLADYASVALDAEKETQWLHLAGSFGPRSPMLDAAEWAIYEVLPLVQKEFPDAKLQIVGRGSREVLQDVTDPSVEVLGQVESVIPFLDRASVALVPLRFESGTRFKILEAGACRKPVVSTTLGAEGIPTTHGTDILIADEPDKFADAINQLLADNSKARSIGIALRGLVEQHFSVDALESQGIAICDYLCSARKST